MNIEKLKEAIEAGAEFYHPILDNEGKKRMAKNRITHGIGNYVEVYDEEANEIGLNPWRVSGYFRGFNDDGVLIQSTYALGKQPTHILYFKNIALIE